MHTYTHTHMYIYVYIHTYTHTCTHTHMYTHAPTHLRLCRSHLMYLLKPMRDILPPFAHGFITDGGVYVGVDL